MRDLPRVTNATDLTFSAAGSHYRVLLVTDGSGTLGACCLTQAPVKEVVGGVPVIDTEHEPHPFLSGVEGWGVA